MDEGLISKVLAGKENKSFYLLYFPLPKKTGGVCPFRLFPLQQVHNEEAISHAHN